MPPFRLALRVCVVLVWLLLGSAKIALAQPSAEPEGTDEPPKPDPAIGKDKPSSTEAPHSPSSPGQEALRLPAELANGDELPFLSPPPPPLDAEGLPILRVETKVIGTRWLDDVPEITGIVGKPLSAGTAREAMRQLVDTGAYSLSAAESRQEGDGAVLTLFVQPRRTIATLRVRGGSLDLRQVFRDLGTNVGGELTEPRLTEVEQVVRNYYQRRGYFGAQVRAETTDTDNDNEVILELVIDAGPPRSVTERVFVIEPHLVDEIGLVREDYAIEKGDRLDDEALGTADNEMRNLLRSKGFYRAEVIHAVRHVGPHSYLYVYLQSGPRLAMTFEGNKAFDDDELADALSLEDQAVGLRPAELKERLRAFYVERGFYDVTIDAKEQGDTSDPIHYLAFQVDEGSQVWVDKRVFVCLPDSEDPDDLGAEIDSYLEEELPGADFFNSPNLDGAYKAFGPTEGAGARPRPRRLTPASTYAPDTYARALSHIGDLYRARGYLNVQVGPLAVVRQRCKASSPANTCIPEPLKNVPQAQCRTDRLGLTISEPTPPDDLTCRPDPSRGIECSSHLTLRIPVVPGPQTTLYDIAIDGNTLMPDFLMASLVGLSPGDPLSNVALEEGRQAIVEMYLESGYVYAEVRADIEPSPDKTRARARFTISEREPVTVSGFVIEGATRTDHDLILSRLALEEGKPYRKSAVRTSEERIATLGTFSSVAISLEDPEVPQRSKRVVVTVVEQLPQYLDPRIGFSTGDGVRFSFEYGHRNIAAQAISLTLRVQLSYLFDFMIIDPEFKENLAPLPVSQQLERRNSARITFPEVGLGPLISASIEGLDVRDNQRDFGLTKQALVPSVTYRPFRQISTTLATSVELNDVQLFNADTIDEAIQKNRSLENLLRVPEGRTFAVAQRLSVAWDRRDNAFNATNGTYISSSVEHVNAFPADIIEEDPDAIDSHFLKFQTRIAGYFRLTKKGAAIALSLAGGYNLQLNSESRTYPDRLFFLGGVDSMRSFLADQLVPEDVAQRILNPEEAADEALTIDDVGIRGGDVSINPRAELRIPLNERFALGLFLDAGNLWVEPTAINPLAMRFGAGPGLRINTPIGPLAFDYGINLQRRPWEDVGAFHFSIGLF